MELDRITESEIEKELEQEILYSAIEEEINQEAKVISRNPKAKKKKKRLHFKKEIKIRTLLLLIITLIMNTYAWFIYIATVSVGLNVHIKSWDFELQNGAQTEDFEFVVENIYPGVPIDETVQNISAANNGEMDALLTCDVVYIRILDKEYSTAQKYTSTPLTELYTSEELLKMLYDDYPFKIKIYLIDTDTNGDEIATLYEGQDVQMPTSSKANIRIQIEWLYEIDDNTLNTTNTTLEATDEIDTYWGKEAYKYHQDNPDEYSIVVKMDIKAIQKDEDGNANTNTITNTTTNTVVP